MFLYSYFSLLFLIIPLLVIFHFFRHKDRQKIWSYFQHPRNWKRDILLSDQGYFGKSIINFCLNLFDFCFNETSIWRALRDN